MSRILLLVLLMLPMSLSFMDHLPAPEKRASVPATATPKHVPHYGETCNNKTWTEHIELLYERDRRSIEGFNSFLKAVADRYVMEKKMKELGISTEKLCDFGKAEVLYCDPKTNTCKCGGKWQKLETKLMVLNGKEECRAELHTKCRKEDESPFKQFKGWSPCEPGSICVVPTSKDIIRQSTPKYGTCVCDNIKYNGKKKRNPIKECECAVTPCQAPLCGSSIYCVLLGALALMNDF